MSGPEDLMARIRRLQDVRAIRNLHNRYLHFLNMDSARVMELWATKTPGATFEAGNSGVYEDTESISRFFMDPEARGLPGAYYEFLADNSVIEISEDGQVAKEVSFSPGITTVWPEHRGSQSKLQAWCSGKYDIDYVKEDGEWRIWQLRWRTTFQTPLDKGWLHQQDISSMRTPPYYPSESGSLTTCYQPVNRWGVNYMLPEPPEPGSVRGRSTP